MLIPMSTGLVQGGGLSSALYVGAANSVLVFDRADPENLVYTGSFTTTDNPTDLLFDTNTSVLYVLERFGSTSEGVSSFDASNLANPTLLNQFSANTQSKGFRFCLDANIDTLLLTNDSGDDVVSFDVSDPSSITHNGQRGSATFLENAHGIVCDTVRRHVFATGPGVPGLALTRLTYSAGAAPVYVSNITTDRIYDLALSADGDTVFGNTLSGEVCSYDVSAASAMSLNQKLTLSAGATGGSDTTVRLFLDHTTDVLYVGIKADSSNPARLVSIDVSDPSAMVELDSLEVGSATGSSGDTGVMIDSVNDVAYFYAGKGFSGDIAAAALYTIDISTPSSMTLLNTISGLDAPLANYGPMALSEATAINARATNL